MFRKLMIELHDLLHPAIVLEATKYDSILENQKKLVVVKHTGQNWQGSTTDLLQSLSKELEEEGLQTALVKVISYVEDVFSTVDRLIAGDYENNKDCQNEYARLLYQVMQEEAHPEKQKGLRSAMIA